MRNKLRLGALAAAVLLLLAVPFLIGQPGPAQARIAQAKDILVQQAGIDPRLLETAEHQRIPGDAGEVDAMLFSSRISGSLYAVQLDAASGRLLAAEEREQLGDVCVVTPLLGPGGQ